MATHDRLPPTLVLEPAAQTAPEPSQGELFARLCLRPLPTMKGEPEDFWLLPDPGAPRRLH